MTDADDTSGLGDLARACRILAREGHNDLTLGHLSLREQSGRGFWLKRAGIGLDEVREARDFVLLSFDGDVLEGDGARHREWPLHAEVFRARPDVRVVGHTHPPWATRFSAVGQALRAVGNYGVLFAEGLPRFVETSDLIETPELGGRVAAALGASRALLLRNHGILFTGSSVAEAAMTAVYLERAAADQLTVAASGLDFDVTPEEELRQKGEKTVAAAAFGRFFEYLCRRLEAAEA